MSKTSLGILFGGQSSEYSVSLHSTGSLLHQIRKDNYDLHTIGITKDGRFLEFDGPVSAIEDDTWESHAKPIAWTKGGYIRLEDNTCIPLDTVFPVLHGKNGEDGTLQGMMEVLNIHCVGCDALAGSMIMDKDITHNILNFHQIPTAKHITLREHEPLPTFEEVREILPLPWFVKPCNAGSSYGVSRVETKEQYEPAVLEAFKWDGRNKALVETAIPGFEIGCAVMGNEEPFAGSVDEIALEGTFFDFEGKYQMEGAAIYCPARISPEKLEEARELAKKAYVAMNCQGLARVDMFLSPDGSLCVNELNTIPGFTATSRYPSMMKEAGIEFPDLIDQLIRLSLEKEVGRC